GRLESIDLDRVLATDFADPSGLLGTEQQLFHRQRYREAVDAVGGTGSHVLDWAGCREVGLEQGGYSLGRSSRGQAYGAAVERMKSALDALCRLWGIGGGGRPRHPGGGNGRAPA